MFGLVAHSYTLQRTSRRLELEHRSLPLVLALLSGRCDPRALSRVRVVPARAQQLVLLTPDGESGLFSLDQPLTGSCEIMRGIETFVTLWLIP